MEEKEEGKNGKKKVRKCGRGMLKDNYISGVGGLTHGNCNSVAFQEHLCFLLKKAKLSTVDALEQKKVFIEFFDLLPFQFPSISYGKDWLNEPTSHQQTTEGVARNRLQIV